MIRGQQRGQLGRSCRLMRRMDIDFANYRPSALRIYATIASSACENAELTHPLGAPHEKSVLLIETNFLVNAMIMLKLNPIIFEWLQLNDYAHQEASLITQK
ncbi:Large ribosomal subunit protein [Trichinella spiralis]|uniref:Large ribosomal subunit protein n=1 Tax=Trichinella spiralis TaxID=6334 RepID=A0ABR3KI95_TRISP